MEAKMTTKDEAGNTVGKEESVRNDVSRKEKNEILSAQKWRNRDTNEKVAVSELPEFQCTEEEQHQLFLDALKRHLGSSPEQSFVVVDAEGVCAEGFVVGYATHQLSFLKANPMFVLGWAEDLYDEMKDEDWNKLNE